ncbi:hypothetical protein B6N54_03190 [Staphylococcus lugdunensis]|nr:hypothetical protein B6N54_03190 [Staphylococcus lugdunensis]ARJ29043.1 hypothetical protein B6N84_03220 [Staphylococcus lugdunensis]
MTFFWKGLFVGAPPQLALFVEMLVAFLCVGAPPQLALLVEFLIEILSVGALIYVLWTSFCRVLRLLFSCFLGIGLG